MNKCLLSTKKYLAFSRVSEKRAQNKERSLGMRNWRLELPPSQTLHFSHTGERETRKTREWLLTKRRGPWRVFSFLPSFAHKFPSRQRRLGTRQGLEQAKISKYSVHPRLFCLRSSFSQSPSRADKIKCYLRVLCPSYSYMVRLLICSQLSHIDIIPIPFLQKALQVWYPL